MLKKKHYADVELTSDDLSLILTSLASRRRELFAIAKDKRFSDDMHAEALDDTMILDKLADRLYNIWLEIK